MSKSLAQRKKKEKKEKQPINEKPSFYCKDHASIKTKVGWFFQQIIFLKQSPSRGEQFALIHWAEMQNFCCTVGQMTMKLTQKVQLIFINSQSSQNEKLWFVFLCCYCPHRERCAMMLHWYDIISYHIRRLLEQGKKRLFLLS